MTWDSARVPRPAPQSPAPATAGPPATPTNAAANARPTAAPPATGRSAAAPGTANGRPPAPTTANGRPPAPVPASGLPPAQAVPAPSPSSSGPASLAPPAATAASPAPRPRGGGRRRAAGPLLAMDCAAALTGMYAAGPAAGPIVAAPLLGVLLLAHRQGGLYDPGFAPSALGELPVIAPRAALAWGFAAAVVAAVAPADLLAWPALLTAVSVTTLAAVALRGLVHRLRRSVARRHPGSTLIVGTGPAARRLAAALHSHPEYGMRPVGIVTPGPGTGKRPAPGTSSGHEPNDLAVHQRADREPDPAADPTAPQALPVLSGHGEITRAVIQNSVRHAVVAGPPPPDPRTGATLRLLAARGCLVWQSGAGQGPVPAAHLWGFACRRLDVGPDPVTGSGPARWAKRGLDAGVAGAALLALAPVLGACALAVRLADGPGVVFRQERIGLDGRPFTLLKFRTLRPGDAHEAATRWNIAGDRRMSAAGRFLRRTSLDELPQLWNVLRGDMSLVGPRPERPYFVQQFSQAHPGYQDRHRMPVGITGLAQVHGLRGDTSIADRARFDNHYIDSWSLWQDISILLRTARSVFRFGGS